MKTSVLMERQFRGGYKIRQDSKNQFFNANDILETFNKTHFTDKKISDYFANDSTKEYMATLFQEGQLEDIIASKRGKNGGTWMHPYLFIDFAMWLSPKLKLTVIRWVYDNLIKLRNEAGDSFKEVNEALFDKYPTSSPFAYSNEAKMINKLVFGSPDAGQRNLATEEQLALLKALQRADIKIIQQGIDYYERYEELKRVKEIYLLTQ